MDELTHEELCDAIIKYMAAHNNGANVEALKQHFNSVNIYNCLEELTASNFIVPESGSKMYYYLDNTGKDILNTHASYMEYKSATLTEFKPILFKEDLERELTENLYAPVNIMPLVKKYTLCKSIEQMAEIRGQIWELLNQLKNAGIIEFGMDVGGELTSRSSNRYFYSKISVRSTHKFEDNQKNKKPLSITIGNASNSVISTGDVSINEFKPNYEINPVKAIEDKKANRIARGILIWTIIGVIVAAASWLIDKLILKR